MKLSAALAITAVLLSWALPTARAGQPAATGPDAAAPGQAMSWRLLAGLQLRMHSIDVSPNGKLGLFWGTVVPPAAAESVTSCWTINLESGRIDDLLPFAEDPKLAAAIGEVSTARFSPDGKHVGILSVAGTNACIIDLATHQTVAMSGSKVSYRHLAWAGDRLLLSGGDSADAYDLAGQRVEGFKLTGRVLDGDQPGRKLLARVKSTSQPADEKGRSVLAVISPDGKVLREIGPVDGVCPWDIHVLSRQGNYAASVLLPSGQGNPKGVFISVTPTAGGETISIRPWAFPLAVSETGEGVLMRSAGGISRQTTNTIEFWSKDGTCQKLVENALAGTIVGDKLFFIQSDGSTPVLRTIALPKSAPASPAPQRPGLPLSQ